MTEYSDTTHIAFDDSIDSDKVDSLHRLLARYIRQKKYGTDVRETIARIVELSGADKTDILAVANNIVTRQNSTDDAISSAVSRIDAAIAAAADKDEDLSEVKDARTDAHGNTSTTLKDRLDAMPSDNDVNFDILSKVDIGGAVPAAWQANIDTFIASLPANSFKVLIVTDTHFEDLYEPGRYSYQYASDGLTHLSVVNQIADHVDAVVAGGDNINGLDGDLARNRADLSLYATKLLSTVTKADKFLLVGNHDDNSASMRLYGKAAVTPKDVLSTADFEDIYRTHELRYGESRDDGSLYFYKDYPDAKVRLIGLNGLDVPQTTNDDGSLKYLRYVDYSYSQKQLDWLANTALATTPKGYAVAIVDHIPVVDYTKSGETNYYNATLLESLISAYARGKKFTGSSDADTPADVAAAIAADYSAAGPRDVAGLWCGHVHIEKLTPLDGYTQVLYLCDVNTFQNNVGTISAVGLQVACVDTDTKKVTIYGLGRSTNRSYTYGG